MTEFEQAIERITGESVKSLREIPLDERRRMVEKKIGRRMSFRSCLPRIMTRQEVEAELDKAIR